ncbi:hypothetical protein AAHC03_01228 [Spirometra sp. Aus1]
MKVERRLRKVFHGSSRLGIDLFLQKFGQLTCPNRNCLDYLLLSLFNWRQELRTTRRVAVTCWKLCERQMLTGHFVKLLMVVMTIIARILIMSEKSIAITANTYNSLYAMRERIPVPTSLASYLDGLPTQIAADVLIKLNPNCTAFMNLRDNSVNGGSSTTVTDSPLPHMQAPSSSKISVKQTGFSPATPLKATFSPMTQSKVGQLRSSFSLHADIKNPW